MAEDGMLLNFDLDTEAVGVKQSFKGGRWKDRLQARKSAAQGKKLTGKRGANFEPIGGLPAVGDAGNVERAVKRRRVEEPRGQNKPPGQESKEVVSSLFTFNPVAKATPKLHEGELPDVAPSNAPLPEGATEFASLGLSPVLATHLSKKLELKSPTAIQKSTIAQLLREDGDVFIQAETGSGKTLAYLLPIVQRLITISEAERSLRRNSGLFAIILAPTRELCRQIQAVLDSLLRCAHWIVAGSVTGGERKKSEKARLRKGLNILVATPGRLADHLHNTNVLDVSSVRWLVLDEGDRLMELGFEQEIKEIVQALENRQNKDHSSEGPVTTDGFLIGLPKKRVSILCSATMRTNVQRLGEVSLKNAAHIQADLRPGEKMDNEAKFAAPAQMKQSYIVVPPKQRLVTLMALLKRTFARKGSVMKAIVFLTCADSVDFHFEVLRRAAPDANTQVSRDATEPKQIASPPPSSPELDPKRKPKTKQSPKGMKSSQSQYSQVQSKTITSSSAPSIASEATSTLEIFRLHGSLPQPVRTSTLRSFSRSSQPAVLLCTDVASRGLDLPSIDLVIEYDPAFSAEDHLHRVGRTARAGRDGRAILFLMPGPEESYVEILESEGKSEDGKRPINRVDADDVLKNGFRQDEAASKAETSTRAKAGNIKPANGSKDWEQSATDWQLDIERWIIESKTMLDLARKAYISHVRAYATHVVPERHMFDVKGLHLGHLAKAFALRDRPGNMGRGSASKKRDDSRSAADKRRNVKFGADNDDNAPTSKPVQSDDTAAKMRKLARAREGDLAGEFNFG